MKNGLIAAVAACTLAFAIDPVILIGHLLKAKDPLMYVLNALPE